MTDRPNPLGGGSRDDIRAQAIRRLVEFGLKAKGK
jgi:hypothetical protein